MTITDPDTGNRVPLDDDLTIRYAQEINQLAATLCDHPRTELRQGLNRGGSKVVRQQCLVCGELRGNPVKQSPDTQHLNEFDEALRAAYQAEYDARQDEVRRRYVALQASRWKGRSEGKTYFQQAHDSYLASPDWAERRRLVMERANSLCEGCRKERATEVHHLTYRNWREEFLFELVALCGHCHDRYHHHDDERDTGCVGCVHAADDGAWCLNFDMPTDAATRPNGACGTDRANFTPDDDYGVSAD
ncbi:MAG: hypothetical protein ABL308_09425 [Oceanicaulis sp.]